MEVKKDIETSLVSFLADELKDKKTTELDSIVDADESYTVKKYFTLGEEIFNSIVHGIGALISIAFLVFFSVNADSVLETVGVILFASTSIILFTMSCLYHAFPRGTTKNVFERFDHLSIYLLIAGTYTPFSFAMVLKGYPSGWILFSILWGIAILGIVLKSIWIKKYVILHTIMFLLMGWSILVIGPGNIYDLLGGLNGFVFLLAGGLSYSIGVIFFLFPLFKFHHAIWHLFVLFGAILHMFAVLLYIL
ncbi:PAQR family membrane homeostasis protein TrhA [Haloplasma contractile]|uniref:Hemolysin III protein n=1 Tax=Haloplasma contractile SSD-17B TaxID=1033810 RepID=U2DXX0_9MOLU|nr:hemolysin III family protein [Haloplasma contractile]ERJ13112.1 Hemolysin III protein [Haloplasma contractile SSD-17B]